MQASFKYIFILNKQKRVYFHFTFYVLIRDIFNKVFVGLNTKNTLKVYLVNKNALEKIYFT